MTLNERIRDLCEKRGLTFKPWEVTPWDVDDGPSPWSSSSGGGTSWPKAQALRRKLIAELKKRRSRAWAADDKPPPVPRAPFGPGLCPLVPASGNLRKRRSASVADIG
jgi:hypothetical protein